MPAMSIYTAPEKALALRWVPLTVSDRFTHREAGGGLAVLGTSEPPSAPAFLMRDAGQHIPHTTARRHSGGPFNQGRVAAQAQHNLPS
jgi:hypothetical protein